MIDWKPIEGLSTSGWVGFDLDGTLAEYIEWNDGKIGKPILGMIIKAKEYIDAGYTVKILTARVASDQDPFWVEEQKLKIQKWCYKYLGKVLEVTAEKNMGMIALYDDRAFRVINNKGYLCCDAN